MANSNINTSWKNDLYPLIDTTFQFEYKNQLNILAEVVDTVTKKQIDYRMSTGGGFGELSDYNGANLVGMNQKRGFVKIITPSEKANSIDIQRLYAMTDKSGECKRVGTAAANSASMTVYMGLLRMFGNFANTATQFLGGDGKPWGAVDHPVASKGDANGTNIVDPDAGTFSNLITDALSVQAVTRAQTIANRYVTPDGLPFNCDFENHGVLLVSPELAPKAKEICGKDARLLPESAENGANPIYGMNYMVVGGGNDGFSAKQWAIADKRQLKQNAKLVYIEKPQVLETDLDNPLIARYVPYVVFGTGFGDARAIIFSNPA